VPSNSTYQDLRVWQEAMDLAEEVYRATSQFPKHELYGLMSQMRRAAVSVPSNIAEGKGHRSDPEFARFLFHARGSLLELQTQLLIARRLQYLSEEMAAGLCRRCDGIGRLLNALINRFRSTAAA
jgi:four helix bundle protein